MEKVGPDLLRACADALEDGRRLDNVDVIKPCEELDQRMLLALNGAREVVAGLPDTAKIVSCLAERVITVSTSDGQTTHLGTFLTNMHPYRRSPRVVIGVFPLNKGAVEYSIRPSAPSTHFGQPDNGYFSSYTHFIVNWEALGKGDPMLVDSRLRADFLFYRQSPFAQDHPYKLKVQTGTHLGVGGGMLLPRPDFFELALEENMIARALHIIENGRVPKLFFQTGFATFINSHASDSRYVQLHAAFTQLRRLRKIK